MLIIVGLLTVAVWDWWTSSTQQKAMNYPPPVVDVPPEVLNVLSQFDSMDEFVGAALKGRQQTPDFPNTPPTMDPSEIHPEIQAQLNRFYDFETFLSEAKNAQKSDPGLYSAYWALRHNKMLPWIRDNYYFS